MADLLGRHSIAPGNLRVAAGLGNPELVEKCFLYRGETTLTSEACAARELYRPHSGFPDWQPSLIRRKCCMRLSSGRQKAAAPGFCRVWFEPGGGSTPIHIGNSADLGSGLQPDGNGGVADRSRS
jgi:hypothetical protein